jgi:hypothetical protein
VRTGAEEYDVRHACGPGSCRAGFSLGEMIVTVVIAAMILTAILTVYGRANHAADAVLSKIETPSLASEVLHLIAQDLRSTLGAEELTVQVRNGFDNGFARAELVLRRTFHDKDDKEQALQEIIWRAGYDRGGDTSGLIIYRSYNGAAPEDKLLDQGREDWEKNYPFVPVCRGVTFFQIQACKGEELVDQWTTPAPPAGVKVTLSFGEPYQTVGGTLDVMEEEKVSRTLVIDATRKIKFAVATATGPAAGTDPNAPKTDMENAEERGSQERTTSGPGFRTKTSGPQALPGTTMNRQTTKGRTTNVPASSQTRPRSR